MVATPAAAPSRHAAPLFDEAFLKKLEYLYIVSKKTFAGRLRADRRSKRVGSGVEFADHRDYVPGDDFRYIDWNLYGRMDRLLVRLFEEEEDLRVYLLVDASRSMGTRTKLAHALQVAAALAYVGLANLDRVSVAPFSEGLRRDHLPPARGKARIFKVLQFLGGVVPDGTTNLARSLGELVHQHKRRGLAVVLSDFYDPEGYEAGLNVLRYQRFEPMVVQVTAPEEVRPRMKGDIELIDCETGELRPVTVSPRIVERYAAAHARFCDELARFCQRHGIPYFRASTDEPFEDLVLRVFRVGGFLR